MVRRIKGEILAFEEGKVLLSLGAAAIEVRTLQSYKDKLQLGSNAELMTHLSVSEREWTLFGFLTEGELLMFENLISVSGIGPKSALAIMSQISADDISRAVSSQSAEFLKQKGLGIKTAEKIVGGLKSKIKKTDAEFPQEQEVYEALLGLGYKEKEIRPVLAKLDPSFNVNNKIKEALKLLS